MFGAFIHELCDANLRTLDPPYPCDVLWRVANVSSAIRALSALRSWLSNHSMAVLELTRKNSYDFALCMMSSKCSLLLINEFMLGLVFDLWMKWALVQVACRKSPSLKSKVKSQVFWVKSQVKSQVITSKLQASRKFQNGDPNRDSSPIVESPTLPKGWMDQNAIWYRGKPRPRRRCVRWNRSSPVFGLCLLWPNGWVDEDASWFGSRPRPSHIVLDGTQLPRERGTAAPPLFSAHVYCGHGRPSELLLSSDGENYFGQCISNTFQNTALKCI